MKFSKLPMTVGAVLTLAVGGIAAHAAPVPNVSMNAQDFVNAFNNANGGTGYHFDAVARTTGAGFYPEINGGVVRLTTTGDAINIDAYEPWNTSGSVPRFTTMQLGFGPRISDYDFNDWKPVPGVATLSYDAATGTTSTFVGTALNVGAAYIYKLFATTELPAVDAYADREWMNGSVRYLMGEVTRVNIHANVHGWHVPVDVDWDNSPYLQKLLSINSDQSYWESAYDPNAYYDEIGDYSIFVMNATLAHYDTPGGILTGWCSGYDFLYIVPVTDKSAVPEPASLSVLALGGLMLMRRRK